MIHIVKGFGIANKAEIDVFLKLSCFFADPATAAAKSLQSCPTLCDPIDGSPPGSPVPGILQAILIPACVSSGSGFLMMYPAYKLNKQADNIQP